MLYNFTNKKLIKTIDFAQIMWYYLIKEKHKTKTERGKSDGLRSL